MVSKAATMGLICEFTVDAAVWLMAIIYFIMIESTEEQSGLNSLDPNYMLYSYTLSTGRIRKIKYMDQI